MLALLRQEDSNSDQGHSLQTSNSPCFSVPTNHSITSVCFMIVHTANPKLQGSFLGKLRKTLLHMQWKSNNAYFSHYFNKLYCDLMLQFVKEKNIKNKHYDRKMSEKLYICIYSIMVWILFIENCLMWGINVVCGMLT